MGFWGALQVLLIALKLANIIDWPWLLVFFPVWLGLVAVAVVIVIAMFCRK